jgi:hypothetical protein
MKNNFGFQGIIKRYKVIITTLNMTKLGFIRIFRPERFHKIEIDSREKFDKIPVLKELQV